MIRIRRKLKIFRSPGVGPLMYVNHDCVPNIEFVAHYYPPNHLCLIWADSKEVNDGDEITVNYGGDYFENGECQCSHCC